MVDEDEASWNENQAQLIDLLIDDEAYTVQKDYLNETKKPSSMTTRMWALHLKAVNTYLPILDLRNNNVSLSEEDLVKIITRNMPVA